MATIIPGIASDETVTLWWVTSIANTSAPSLATEINAATSIRLECLLTENFAPDVSAEVGTVRRACSKTVLQRGGTVTYTISDLVYAYDPQNPTAASNLSKAYATLVKGAKGFLVARWGVNVNTAAATAQKVDVWQVEISYGPFKMAPEANSELKAKSGVLSISDPVFDAAIAA